MAGVEKKKAEPMPRFEMVKRTLELGPKFAESRVFVEHGEVAFLGKCSLPAIMKLRRTPTKMNKSVKSRFGP